MGKRPQFARIGNPAMNRRDFARGLLVSGLGAALGFGFPYDSGPALAQGRGPPPHAPAHGYRHKLPNGAELIYDTGIGVYVVAGLADLFFSSGLFYRFINGSWKASAGPGGPWTRVTIAAVPVGLRLKFLVGGPPARRGGGGRRGKGRK